MTEYENDTEFIDSEEISDEDIYLTNLIEVEILQKIQDAFSNMSRMAALTADANGIAVTKGSRFSEFCNEFCRLSPIGKKDVKIAIKWELLWL